jgi:hypothetical protein
MGRAESAIASALADRRSGLGKDYGRFRIERRDRLARAVVARRVEEVVTRRTGLVVTRRTDVSVISS